MKNEHLIKWKKINNQIKSKIQLLRKSKQKSTCDEFGKINKCCFLDELKKQHFRKKLTFAIEINICKITERRGKHFQFKFFTSYRKRYNSLKKSSKRLFKWTGLFLGNTLITNNSVKDIEKAWKLRTRSKTSDIYTITRRYAHSPDIAEHYWGYYLKDECAGEIIVFCSWVNFVHLYSGGKQASRNIWRKTYRCSTYF